MTRAIRANHAPASSESACLSTITSVVLRLMAQGYRPQEIALMRGVPVRRIYWVGNKLRRRFGAETNEQLMVRAAAEGFLA